MGVVTWLLRTSEVDLPELDTETTDQAVAMAGEKAVALTTDRTNILIAAAAEIEEYVGRLFYRGLAGSVRACTTVIELDEPGDVPAVAQFPLTDPVIVTSALRWDDAAAAFQASEFIVRPVGMVRLPAAGTYRLVANATPTTNYPPAVHEAVARLFAFREIHRPQRGDGVTTDSGLPQTQTGAMMRSGAAEVIRHVPRYRV